MRQNFYKDLSLLKSIVNTLYMEKESRAKFSYKLCHQA